MVQSQYKKVLPGEDRYMTEIGYDIYGDKLPEMKNVLQDLETHISSIRDTLTDENGMDPIEHFLARIKSDESMREKCRRLIYCMEEV